MGGLKNKFGKLHTNPPFAFFFSLFTTSFFSSFFLVFYFPTNQKKNPPIKIDSKLNKIPPFHPSTWSLSAPFHRKKRRKKRMPGSPHLFTYPQGALLPTHPPIHTYILVVIIQDPHNEILFFLVRRDGWIQEISPEGLPPISKQVPLFPLLR